MVKKAIANLDSSKLSGPDFIPVVALKNCESGLSYILPEPLSRSLGFQIVGRSQYFKKLLGKGLQLKTTALLVFFLWLLKSLKNL